MWDELCVRLRRALRRRGRAGERRARAPGPHRASRVVLLALAVFAFVAGLLELRLRPTVQALAAQQISRRITAQITARLRQIDADYDALVTIHRDEAGNITAVSANMGGANVLRLEIIQAVLDAIERIDAYELGVPLGTLLDLDLLWGKGPVISVRGLTAGTVDARLNSEFRAAGINQTLHRILLDVRVPVSLLLPGGSIRTEVETSLCLAETLIVGRVPQTYLGFSQS